MVSKLFSFRYLLFLSFCVTLSIFLGPKGINYALVGVIALSPIFVLLNGIKPDKYDCMLFVMLTIMYTTSLLHHSFRLTSFLFSFCFVFSFIYIKGEVGRGRFPLIEIDNLLKKLIYIYTIVLIIQLICVCFGLHPFLANLYLDEFKWKLSSLSNEPSHFSVYIFFMMYGYILIAEKIKRRRYSLMDAKKEKLLWFSYFVCMLFNGSTSGLLYVFLIFVRFVRLRSIILYITLSILVFGGVYFLFRDSVALTRVLGLFNSLFSFNAETFLAGDHSAAMRFAPMIYFFSSIDIINIDFWLGHGMDYGKTVFNVFVFDLSGDVAYNDIDGVNLGGFWGFILDYGFVPFFLLFLSFASFFKKIKDRWFVIFYISIMIFIGFNMQMFWFATILAYMISYDSLQSIRQRS